MQLELVTAPITKQCTKCGEAKPATVEWFKRRKGDALHTQCKLCDHAYYMARREYNLSRRKKYYMEHRREHPAKVLARQGLKKCSKCSKVLPATLEYFRHHILGREGLHPWCRECDLADSRRLDHANRARISAKKKVERKVNATAVKAKDKYYRTKNPRRISEARLRHFYGLSVEDVEWMKQQQNGRCAICGKLPTGNGGRAVLCIDHDHETNQVRELLCGACNSGLGQFRDSIEILGRAMEYLRKHKKAGIAQCA